MTVVVADLVGFSAAAQSLDPEDLRRTQGRFFSLVRDAVENAGGVVEKYVGDGVVAVFGAPTAHENDPYRAVRAALDLQQRLDGELLSDGRPVQARVGVSTGEALVSLGRGEALVTGDVTATAEGLQGAAPPGGVLVGPLTHRATTSTVRYDARPPVRLPGRTAPIEAWLALGLAARADDVPDDRPLVGRDLELRLLATALHRATDDSRGQLVTLVGDPGLGKSRLVRAVRAHAEARPGLVRWRSGQCVPYGSGVSFWALGQVVKAQAGVLESDSATVARQRLAASVQGVLQRATPGTRAAVVDGLAALLGVGGPSGESGGEAASAWRRYLLALADDAPTVLVVEDLHWADDALLDFLVELVDAASALPLLVLTTARPELVERRPGWGGGLRDALVLSLPPLTADETGAVLDAALGGTAVDPSLRARVVSLVGGNPLYAEEFARVIAERGGSAEVPLPDSVQGVLDSRLDLLEPAERTVVSAAAVVGEVFWEGAVAAVAAAERSVVQACLATLEEREVVRRLPRSSVEGEPELAFRHVLLRDAAYARLPRTSRLEQHERCAEWVERLAAARGDDLAELRAHHRLAAHDAAAALGLDTAPWATPAREALLAAAERALRVHALPAALSLSRRAVELWPEDDPSPAHWCAVVFAEEVAALTTSGAAASVPRLSAAVEALLAVGAASDAARGLALLGRTLLSEGQPGAAREQLARAVALLSHEADDEQRAACLAGLALAELATGNRAAAVDRAEAALAAARASGTAHESRAEALVVRGRARLLDGDAGGIDDQEEALALARRHGLRVLDDVAASLVASWEEQGRLARAHAVADEVGARTAGGARRGPSADQVLRAWFAGELRRAVDLSDRLLAAPGAELDQRGPHLRALRAWARLLQGNRPAPDLDRAVDAALRAGCVPESLPALAFAAACCAAEGEQGRAGALLDELLRRWSGMELRGSQEWLQHVVFTSASLGGGLLEEVTSALEAHRRRTAWVEAALLSAGSHAATASGDAPTAFALADAATRAWALTGDVPGAASSSVQAARAAAAAGERAAAAAHADEVVRFVERSGAVVLLDVLPAEVS